MCSNTARVYQNGTNAVTHCVSMTYWGYRRKLRVRLC